MTPRTAFTLVTGAGLAAYAAHVAFGFGGEGSEGFFQDWLYNALVLSAAVSGRSSIAPLCPPIVKRVALPWHGILREVSSLE